MSGRAHGPITTKPTMAAVLDFYGVQYREHVFGWQNILCPFTPEDRPSFRVNLDEGGFACLAHPDEKGGDSIAFVMRKQGFTMDQFKEALAFCATIPGEREDGPEETYSRRGSGKARSSSGKSYRPDFRRRRSA
jgi:hypothetical protein